MTVVYIGPYLVVPPTRQVRNEPERVCSHHCDKPAVDRPAKFCGNCGGAVVEENVPVEEVKPLPLWKLDAKWTDVMSRPEYGQRHPKGDMWLPNRTHIGMRFDRGSEDVYTPVQLSELDSEAMLAKAQANHSALVEMLKSEFGVEAFWEVGVVVYAY